MAQMAHFSFPYNFTIPNSEFRISKFALRILEFGIRNCEVYIILVRTLKLKKGLFFEFNAPTIRKDEFSIL